MSQRPLAPEVRPDFGDMKELVWRAISPIVTPLQNKIAELNQQADDLMQQFSHERETNQKLKLRNDSLRRKCSMLEDKLRGTLNEKENIKSPASEVGLKTESQDSRGPDSLRFSQREHKNALLPSSLDLNQDNTVPAFFNSSQELQGYESTINFGSSPIRANDHASDESDASSPSQQLGKKQNLDTSFNIASSLEPTEDPLWKETQLQETEANCNFVPLQKIEQELMHKYTLSAQGAKVADKSTLTQRKAAKGAQTNFDFGLITPTSITKQDTSKKLRGMKRRRFGLVKKTNLMEPLIRAKGDTHFPSLNFECTFEDNAVTRATPKRRRVDHQNDDLIKFHPGDFEQAEVQSVSSDSSSQKRRNKTIESADIGGSQDSFIAEFENGLAKRSSLMNNGLVSSGPDNASTKKLSFESKTKSNVIYNVDQIIERIEKGKNIDMTYNPLSGKAWILEDFRSNSDIEHSHQNILKRALADFDRKTSDAFDCPECKNFYDAVGYGIKMNSPAWDETQSEERYKKVAPKLFKCKHKYIIRPANETADNTEDKSVGAESPPGFFRSEFPSTQVLKEEKALAKRKADKETLGRFLTAVAQNPRKRAFIFRNKIFNNVVQSNCCHYDSDVIADLYSY